MLDSTGNKHKFLMLGKFLRGKKYAVIKNKKALPETDTFDG